MNLKKVLPNEIEKESFRIITEELHGRLFDPFEEPIIKRCIHTSADFDYADNLKFSRDAVLNILKLLKYEKPVIYTDTQMAKSGISSKEVFKYASVLDCLMSEVNIAKDAKDKGITRAAASVLKVAELGEENPVIYIVGNAPTALVQLKELYDQGKFKPRAIIGVPVGFVNVVESKELIMQIDDIPWIVAKGRKGGSNIAACIMNALLYMLRDNPEIV